MSGGVDSSVSAYLLKNQGYTVEGLFMKNWQEDDDEHCSAETDLSDAKAVCAKLNIPLHTVNFSHKYWDKVFSHFLDEYKAGRTPNPDILCNKEIKFKAFFDHAIQMGADYIATGHYARNKVNAEGVHLLKGSDRNKDQSYFLYAVPSQALHKTIFPLGEMQKQDVRQIAKDLNLVNHDKKDSTGICFIGERKFKRFLSEYLLAQPGDIIQPNGEVLGRHDGLMYYTLGQRQGLGIGGRSDAIEQPWYVVAKDTEKNQLIVAQGNDHPLLFSQGLYASQLHWFNDIDLSKPLTCHAKTRYRQACQACLVSQQGDDRVCVVFSDKQRAVTPGQSVVFYHKNECLGGGIIDAIIP